MAGAVVRTPIFTKHLLNPAKSLLTSIQRQTACGLHWQKAKPVNSTVTGSHCCYQVCCHGFAKSRTSLPTVHGAGYSSYSASGCVISLCVSEKELQGESRAVSSGMYHNNSACITQVRNKSRSTQQDTENEESDSDEDDALNDDDFEAPPQFKVIKITAVSNRADSVISHGLSISRNQLDEIFLKSGLYLNGEKLLKKSVKMDPGDYADVVLEKAEDQLKVKRVKVLKIYPDKTNKERMKLKVRVWRAPFFLPKPDHRPRDS